MTTFDLAYSGVSTTAHAGQAVTSREVFEILRSLLGPGQDNDVQYITGCTMIEAYARTLACNTFSESLLPPDQAYPTLDAASQTVAMIVSENYSYNAEDFSMDSPSYKFLSMAKREIRGKKIIKCTAGYVGAATPSTQAGDIIYVFLGCKSAMVLRHLDTWKYLVVGECFIHGFSDGEALLGPLQPNFRLLGVYREGLRSCITGFERSGEIFYEDPITIVASGPHQISRATATESHWGAGLRTRYFGRTRVLMSSTSTLCRIGMPLVYKSTREVDARFLGCIGW